MHHQADAGGPERGTLAGAMHLLGEVLGEFALHDRDIHPGLLEDLSLYDAHFAAAAFRPVPCGADEAPRLRASCVLDRLELRADAVAQACKPGGGGGF